MTSRAPSDLPEATHQTEIVVTNEHIDELQHVNNVRWVHWVIDIAVAHSTAVGLDIPAYIQMGAIWVVRRHEVDYLAPARMGERIHAQTWVDSYGKSSSIRKSVFRRASDGKPLLRAATTWVMVDMKGQPVPVPEAVIAKLPARPDN